MADTRIWRTSCTPAAEGDTSYAGQTASRGHRAVVRLWALLHAQTLMRGVIDGPHDAAVIEDDYRRLAAWQQT
jgi:hypothetical protein